MVSVQPPAALAASPTSANFPLAMRTFDTTVRFASMVWILPLVSSRKRPAGQGCAKATDGTSSARTANARTSLITRSNPTAQ